MNVTMTKKMISRESSGMTDTLMPVYHNSIGTPIQNNAGNNPMPTSNSTLKESEINRTKNNSNMSGYSPFSRNHTAFNDNN